MGTWLRKHLRGDAIYPPTFLRRASSLPREKTNDTIQLQNLVTGLVTEKEKGVHHDTNSMTGDSSSIGAKNDLLDLILGIAQDTDPKNFAVFCKSLRRWSQFAEAIIFVNSPVPVRHKDIASKTNVKIVEYDLATLSSTIQKYHPSTLRWPLFFRFFHDPTIRSQYGRVLMMDVRDSYFQSDPFSLMPPPSKSTFYAFNGVESITIGQCGWNGGWVKDCFGDSMLNEIREKKIICSGISAGTVDVVFHYLTLMDDIIMAKHSSDISKAARFPRCERNGVDQVSHKPFQTYPFFLSF